VQVADLIRLYPRLFHMAAAGSWPSIQRHGLLSTSALATLWGSEEAVSALRQESVLLEHPEFGRAVVRDQKPIHRESLEEALAGEMSVEDWLAELNSRVFFFVQIESLRGLMGSPAYRNHEHDVLTVDTRSLVGAHEERIVLAGMNTGFAQRHNHKARGHGTFQRIADYPHPPRTVARVGGRRELVELCIPGAVPDIADHVIRVDRMRGGEVVEPLFAR
jgi:hypothetical protein